MSDLRSRLDGINRLLKDVYGKEVWLGRDLLVKQGVSQKQVARWRKDEAWLLGFLKRLERKLLADLAESVPGHDPRVVSCWYGFGGSQALSVPAVAAEIGKTPAEVRDSHKTLLGYLRSSAGRMALQRTVAMAMRGDG